MSQTADILNHLKRAPINPVQALNQYGCFRLAARIKDLRDEGHKIQTETNVSATGKRYAVYKLEPRP